jgi:hypothetical protein
MNQGNGSRSGALFYTAAAEPALFRIKDDGGLSLLRIGHHHIGRAYLQAEIASVAFIRMKLDSPVW